MLSKKCLAILMITISLFPKLINAEELISLFPLENYNQDITAWIKPSDSDFDKSLMNSDIQNKHFDIFLDHYIGLSSPWSKNYINQLLKQQAPHDLKSVEQWIINNFDNKSKSLDKLGYGENFHPYTKEWIENIVSNINISQFDHMIYLESNRGIAVDNLHVRALPTEDVYFYSHKIAGEGYPFDNLQVSVLWAGTPVYILGESRDHDWMMIVSPDFIGWVKSNGIVHVNTAFIKTWTDAAKNKLAAITRTKTSIIDENGEFLFSAYVGAVFPAFSNGSGIKLLVPGYNSDHQGIIKTVDVSSDKAAFVPILATPHHFKIIIQTLLNRPYGWGGMYFYNDCSAEMKSLLAPFGIWLPRHSSDQVSVGKQVDLSYASPEKRLAYLMENGQRFLTIIYIGGHVLMYIGNYPNPFKNTGSMAMTYQNMWGLSPNPATKRSVIGESVLFPMLLEYPEDTHLVSLVNKKHFQVSFLNQFPDNTISKQNMIDVESLMRPGP